MREFSIEMKIALLEERVPRALEMLNYCKICSRDCRVNRNNGELGICGVDSRILIASSGLHFGEEPPISGTRGSGTIFLAGCNMKCVYCQNYPISQLHNGEPISISRIADIMIALQGQGAHNINLVTPSHYVPQIMAALLDACRMGLSIPIVWNSSGYDKATTLAMLDGIIDIYMPDMRYSTSENAQCYSSAADYPEVNKEAIREMYRQVADLIVDNYGVAVSGLLIRHLVLPDNISGSSEIFSFIADQISKSTHVSLMSQYFPAYKATKIEAISRRIQKKEYQLVIDAFERAGLYNGYAQPFLE
jgi:putative pyruvate formate lyase activating enzyme